MKTEFATLDAVSNMHLAPLRFADRHVVLALSELYAYDFSELVDLDVDETGHFRAGRIERHFDDPLCHPFLVRLGDKIAGFAIHEGRSRLTGEQGVNDVAEFFVLRKYRRLGVGAQAATALFTAFPGAWEVRQIPINVAATSFWRKVIHRHTGGHYEEVEWNDAQFRGVVQRFG